MQPELIKAFLLPQKSWDNESVWIKGGPMKLFFYDDFFTFRDVSKWKMIDEDTAMEKENEFDVFITIKV